MILNSPDSALLSMRLQTASGQLVFINLSMLAIFPHTAGSHGKAKAHVVSFHHAQDGLGDPAPSEVSRPHPCEPSQRSRLPAAGLPRRYEQ